ncbi:hypothetical protein QR680_016061 [Steinernema hermaphroditum]|uniref:Metalloendopeptidase n=1 Tax=Steinernema hermaphroditum TaxID=289476 RepID=A0AA39LLY1_9BILA|nr:hypothetical protein QR680_016061 [Steinernema hermaphroditum]
MRTVAILFALFASSCALSFVERKELLQQNYPEFKDIDAIAEVIAQHKARVEPRLQVEQNDREQDGRKRAVENMEKHMRPLPDAEALSIPEINAELGLDDIMVEGDIMMTLDEIKKYYGQEGHRSKRQAFQGEGYPGTLWNGTINYGFDPRFEGGEEAQDLVDRGVAFWQEHTCVRFHKVDNIMRPPKSDNPLLLFHSRSGCGSRVGRNSDVHLQAISIGPKCHQISAVTHEIAHALGFIHEQQRCDRNDYIKVDIDNVIETERKMNYDQYSRNDNNNYGKQYDYRGIMHYFDTAFTKQRGEKTMYALNPDYQPSIGGEELPGFGDIYEMNTLYSCYVNKVVGNGRATLANKTDPYQCTWHVKAPEGKKVQYIVSYVGHGDNDDSLCYPRCSLGGLSIKGIEKTWLPGGMRVCCTTQFNKTVTTASNLLVIQPWNVETYTDFTIQYKIEGEAPATPAPTKAPVKSYRYGPYIFVSTGMSFNDANAFCQSEGYHLLSIHSKDLEGRMQQVFKLLDPQIDSVFWFGLRKPQGVSSKFSWTDGSNVDYTNWTKGLPRATQQEECGAYWSPSWVALPCHYKQPFVCDKS